MVSSAGVASASSSPISRAQALAYARTVNLQPGDLPGFTVSASEEEAPPPGPLVIRYDRCLGGERSQIAHVSSREFSAGRALESKIVWSNVTLWPTAATSARETERLHSSGGLLCLRQYLHAVRTEVNRARKGHAAFGPFVVTTAHEQRHGFSVLLTRIDETRLLRTGAVLAHVYRDKYEFVSGAAAIELEATGFGHSVSEATEQQALQVLLARARRVPAPA